MRIDPRWPLAAACVLAIARTGPAEAAATMDVLYSFCAQQGCPDGDQPYGGVTLLSSRKLVGTTGFGGKYSGTVFALDDRRGTWTLKSLKSFCVGTPPSCQPDEGPSVTLVADTNDNLYGTVYFGGANDQGGVFELEAKGGNKYALRYLYSFSGSDGSGPWELSYAGQNTGARYNGTSPLYGTTIAGGAGNAGTVFSLTPVGGKWNFATLWNFCAAGCGDGALPRGGVIVDPSGNLFGTTSYEGPNNGGAIFELSNAQGAWDETTLYAFCAAANCSDGSGPFAGLAEDAAGNLYGTTYFGGNANDGVVFKFGTGGYSVLHQFCSQGGCTDGSEPAAAVTLDTAGDIFGTAGRGGDGNYGVVFEIANGKYKRVYSFCAANGCSDGGYPYGTLALDARGRIYGTTQYGGAHGLGEVYRLK